MIVEPTFLYIARNGETSVLKMNLDVAHIEEHDS